METGVSVIGEGQIRAETVACYCMAFAEKRPSSITTVAGKIPPPT
jgi:hypothetical protein